MSTSPGRRRWFLLGCAGSVGLVLVAGLVLFTTYRVWCGRRQAQQRAAVAKVEALGGEAQHTLSSLSQLAILQESGDAPNVFLLNERGLTDDDLVLFESAPTTRRLFLFMNQLSDNGLVHLKNLHELETLDLRRNGAITDAGLVHLENLKNLKQVYLMGTSVTLAGVNKLQAKLPGAKIHHSAGP